MSDMITLDVAIARLDELDDANEERQSDGEMAATFLGKRLRDSLDPFHRDWEAVKDGIASLRDELAECRAKLATAEQDRSLGWKENDLTKQDLAAAQAESLKVQEALASVFRSRPWLGDEPDMVPARRVALSTPTGSRAALREMMTQAWDDGEAFTRRTMTADFTDHRTAARNEFVARLLGDEGYQS